MDLVPSMTMYLDCARQGWRLRVWGPSTFSQERLSDGDPTDACLVLVLLVLLVSLSLFRFSVPYSSIQCPSLNEHT